jgi:hypothetical protein
MITISDRTEYIGSHIRPEVKDALREDARKRAMSISSWVADAIESRLLDEGYDLNPKNTGPKPILDAAEAAAE